ENIRLYGGIYELPLNTIKSKADELLQTLRLQNARDKLIGSLPLGWKQKLAFSVAVMHEPDIVFLDEPTGGVDPITRRQFWEQIYKASEEGTTLFVTTHYMDEAEYCDRVSMMVDGRIEALNTPSGLKDEYRAESIEQVFIELARGAERVE